MLKYLVKPYQIYSRQPNHLSEARLIEHQCQDHLQQSIQPPHGAPE